MPLHNRHLRLGFALVALLLGACSSPSNEPAGPSVDATGGRSGSGGRSGAGGSATPSASGGSPSVGSGGASVGSGGSGSGGSSGSSDSGGSSGGSASGGSSGSSGGAAGSSADAAVATDSGGAGDDAGPSSGGPLPPGMRKVVILHDVNAGGSAGDPSRKSMADILASMKDSHGIVVTMMDSPTKAAQLMDAALVIVGPNSSMFGANHPDPGLKTLPVPLMVSKDGNTTEIGLGAAKATDPPNFNRITIIKTDHPLAAGLPMGNTVVLTTPAAQRIIAYGNVGPDAIKIAVGPQSTTTYAIVGYEKGGDMGGGVKAPAKRVGFFWHRPAAATPEGAKLFRAAVDWLLRP